MDMSYGIIDAHIHLNHLSDESLKALLSQAKKSGIAFFVNNGIKQILNPQSVVMTDSMIKNAVGISHHLSNADFFQSRYGLSHDEMILMMKDFFKKPGVIAIGEVGLEIPPKGTDDIAHYNSYRNKPFNDLTEFPSVDEQLTLLLKQFDLAAELGVPVICHSGNSNQIFSDLLKKQRWNNLKGMIHGFTGTEKELEDFISMGVYVSVNHSIFYSKHSKALQAILNMGLNRYLLVETDSPGFHPDNEDEINSFESIHLLINKLADHFGVSAKQVIEVTSQNTTTLFNLKGGCK